MREYMGLIVSVAISAVLMAGAYYMYGLFKDYKQGAMESDRVAVVSSLINYQQRYGQYPIIEPMKDNKKVDKASIELDKKIRKGVLDAKIKDNIVEIDIKAMHDSLHLSKQRRYYMIKGNPYTVFSGDDAHKDGFTLTDKTLMYTFSNAQVSSSTLSVNNKKMDKVEVVKNIPGNMTLIGGKGNLYLAKIVDKKLFELKLSDDIMEVFNITDKVISTHLKDGSTKIYSIEEVYK